MAVIEGSPSTWLVQGYLAVTSKVELRVRTSSAGQVLTVKGPLRGIERPEQECILEDHLLALALLEACDGRVLVKTRYMRRENASDGVLDVWTIDEYGGDNRGLVIAEYEYPEEHEDRELPLPDWVGREVTGVPRFYAQNLSVYPYREWTDLERE
jgi:adenylate cyclase